jgi:hypothetical protein
MKGLEHNAELRAFILAATTGIKEKIALKKSWEDAASDLKLAFDEGETSAEAIVELFPADQCVRHLEAPKIWQFLSEGEFWNVAPADVAATGVAREHLAYLLDSALEEELIDQRDVVEAITVAELANRLPREHLGALLRCALETGANRSTFTAVDLLATTGPRVLVQYVPLPNIWNAIVRPRIARRHGYEVSQESSARNTPPAAPAPASATTSASATATQSEPAPAFLHQDDPEEITRVMPGAMFAAELARAKESAVRSGVQRAVHEDPFSEEDIDGAIVMIDDAAKAV